MTDWKDDFDDFKLGKSFMSSAKKPNQSNNLIQNEN